MAYSEFTLTQLRYFVAAATHRSMTAASIEMHVVQSAISTAITQLEQSLDVQLLLRRRSKGLVLTDAGKLLLRDARSLLSQVDEMVDTVRGESHEVRGTLRLACFVTLAPFVLPALISRVQERHPRLQFEMIEADGEGLTELMRNGAVEGAIAYDFAPVADLAFDHLYSSVPHVILPPDHRLAGRREVSLADLAHESLILLDIDHRRDYFLRMLQAARITPIIRYTSRNIETVGSLVARGHGYAIVNHVPQSSRTHDGGQVATIRIVDAPALDVCFVRMAGVRPTARGRMIAALTRELFGAAPRAI